ncbi:hypothetical protein F2Q68_00030851 [Brassica cretica]|uniref:Uncharacterized protein n=1 Tax=Brassica cretica TaxID=69181 RepID=A0A8S9GEE9_BRACR|nr:hypothetical protein F2Q68_00030851 [Brassica cretica]
MRAFTRASVETELPETRSDEYDEDYHREKNIEYHGLAMDDQGLLHTSSANATSTSIDSRPTPSIDVGRAQGMDGSILNVSKEDFAELFVMHGSDLFCQPKEESTIPPSIDKRTLSSIDGMVTPAKDSYNKAEIDELVEEIYRVIRTFDDFHSKRLDDIYYPFDKSISWLTTCTEERMQDLAMLQK